MPPWDNYGKKGSHEKIMIKVGITFNVDHDDDDENEEGEDDEMIHIRWRCKAVGFWHQGLPQYPTTQEHQ